MRRIFVTRHIPDVGLAMLRRRRGVVIDVFTKDRVISPRELRRSVRGAEVLVPLLTDRIDARVMDAAGPSLKMVANYAVGFDNIDLKEAGKRGILVTNAPCTEMTESVAEHVIAHIFALAHRIAEADRFTRRGKYHGWNPALLLGSDIYGKTLGIIGAGAIGSALARRMRDGFDVTILYSDIARNHRIEVECGAKFVTRAQLLKRSDIVSLHVPLLPSTRHLIGAKELRAMKTTAFLVNTSRGPVVDEAALIAALRTGEIAGAGIDVYEHEPHIPRALRKLRNVVLTPHTASATDSARSGMSRAVAVNILAYLSGKQPPNALISASLAHGMAAPAK